MFKVILFFIMSHNSNAQGMLDLYKILATLDSMVNISTIGIESFIFKIITYSLYKIVI
jgi:hypothetical protein